MDKVLGIFFFVMLIVVVVAVRFGKKKANR